MRVKHRDSYEVRMAKKKREADAKKRDMKALLKSLDSSTAKAVDSDAYHEGDVEALSRARSAVMAVLGGYTKRTRR